MIMARDGRISKARPCDWPVLLGRLMPPSVWSGFRGQVAENGDPRVRWSIKLVVLGWSLIGWSVQSGLTDRFAEAFECLAKLYVRRRRPGRTLAGFTKASVRLGSAVFLILWRCIRERLPRLLGPAWTWGGWVVLAADGSRLDAPRTRANEKRPGCAGQDKTHPQWWVTCIIHLPSRLLWEWRLGPADSAERTHVREMCRHLPENALLVADAGFVGFDLFCDLLEAGVQVLVRGHRGVRLLSDAPAGALEQRGDGPVYLWPQNRRGQSPLALRLIVLKRQGKRVYLLTSVLEPTRLSRAEAGRIYAARWGIETGYRALKQTLQRRRLQARTPGVGEVELAGSLLALALLLALSALVLRARIDRVSIAAALRAIRRALEALRWGASTRACVRRLEQAVRDEYQRRSSKRARDWPHKKTASPAGRPQLRRPTRREFTRIQAANTAANRVDS